MKAALDEVPPELRGFTVSRTAKLATFLAYAGDFDAADDAVSYAASTMLGLRTDRWRPDSRNLVNYLLDEARAAVAQSKGDLIEAEALYHRAIERNDKMSFGRAVNWGAFTRIELAGNLTRQGRLLEAENALRESLASRLAHQTQTPFVAKALGRLSGVLYEQGRYVDAEALADATVRLYEAMCAAPESLSLAAARDVLGKSLVAQERWTDAIAVYEAARVAMANDVKSYDRLFAGNLYRALALLRAGRTAEAAKGLTMALERNRERLGDKHYKTAEIQGFLAMARAVDGDQAGALQDFAAATKILLTRSRDSDDEDSSFKARDRRLAVVLGAYIGLLADVRGTSLESAAGIDAAGEAFRLAEVARARAVQRALSASGARAALTDPGLAELARREQDTQKQIAALYGTLATVLSQLEDEDQAQALRQEIDSLRGARAALAEEIGRRFPEYSELINPRPATIADAQSALRPGEALIATYVGEERTFVWAVPNQGAAAFGVADIGHKDLADTVALLRSALEPNAATLGDIPAFDVKAALGLYQSLLAPVRAGWKESTSLIVIAHGPLGYLPLSLLPTGPAGPGSDPTLLFADYRGVPWLARSHAVTVMPSVASLRSLRKLPAGSPARRAFAGFADPVFGPDQVGETPAVQTAKIESRGVRTRGLPVRLRAAPETAKLDTANLASLPRLPDTADEVRAIAVALKADLTRDVFIGARASEGAVKTLELSGYRVLAFATHGLVPGDLDGLTQPALALSAPDVTGGEDDGLLTMGEILGLRLDADWVVLSACNTGSGEGAGAEAVSGLGRAFFYAGTRALLVSNWPVETTSAKALTTDLFARQAADPPWSGPTPCARPCWP